jgi:hypothetical protein
MLDSVKKGFDFVRKNLDSVIVDKQAIFGPEPLPGFTNVYYVIRECPKDISDFPDGVVDREECVVVIPCGAKLSVNEIVANFPIRDNRCHLRFKIEDDLFGFVWLDGLSGDDIVPTYRNEVHMEVVLCHAPTGIGHRRVSSESAPASFPAARPPNRDELVKARLEREAAQIQAARDLAQANAQGEVLRRQEKLDMQNLLGPELDRWAMTEQGKFKDVRSLLSSMSSVLWAGSGWDDPAFGELMINDSAVKKTYRKAIIMCHPDKHQGASTEQQYRADRIFNAINESFKSFNSK